MGTRPLHERLVERHPLPKKDDRAAAARGLAEAAAAYAKQGAYEGAKGPWWRVWRAIERARGRRLGEALASLGPEARRWFAVWSFGRGRTVEGARAYRAYLADTGGIGPFDRENLAYLEAIAPRVAADELLRVADDLRARTRGASPAVARFVLERLVSARAAAGLAARFPRPAGATLHDGAAWARHAIACAVGGDAEGAELSLGRAAKLGVGIPRDGALVDRMLATLGVSAERWAELRGPFEPPEGDLLAAWLPHRGSRPEPTRAPSPHAFGGDRVTAPACPGCGHAMHAYFVFDVASVPALAERLPGWPWLPLVGCLDCSLHLVRRDFRLDFERQSIELLGVSADEATLRSFGKASSGYDRIALQPVALRAIAPDAPPEDDRTQVGGEPGWVQDFERAFCPLCFEEMRFVASLGQGFRSGLEPELVVHNGSGSQYHFACAPCRTLAVFGQNT
jgi:hypothetical protein